MAAPRATHGCSRATFHSAWAFASSSIPLEMSGRPQHFLSTSWTR
jgi:hypothetical protein